MTATPQEAQDALFGQFSAGWPACSSITGSVPEIRWQGVLEAQAPDVSTYWVRVSDQEVMEVQANLRGGDDIPATRRYRHNGLMFVQVFAPINKPNSKVLGRQLADFAKNIFRGKTLTGGIWLRNCRVSPLEADSQYHRWNVIIEYQYDEIG